jgi:CheY-like chemotaxis protein
VLLVDDYADNRDMYAEFLRFSGYRVVVASNGKEALDQVARSRPSVVVMDLTMPVMDGWEARRRLKADPATRPIPVVVLTGNALKGADVEARRAGCDAYLVKPCLPEDLHRTIVGVLGGSAGAAANYPGRVRTPLACGIHAPDCRLAGLSSPARDRTGGAAGRGVIGRTRVRGKSVQMEAVARAGVIPRGQRARLA